MKKLFLFASLISIFTLYADDPKRMPKKDDKDWIQDQHDETDTYAIPLDDSEAEEEEEMNALQKQQKPTMSRPCPKESQK